MLDMTAKAIAISRDRGKGAFDGDEAVRLALVHLIQTVGESAARVSGEFRSAHPEIPWMAIVGMRNKIVHDYLTVDYEVVWQTAIEDLPALAGQLARLLS
jgi:uncharacterized protein with HEPN domain